MAISYLCMTTVIGGALECTTWRLSQDRLSYIPTGPRDPSDILAVVQAKIDSSQSQVIAASPRPAGYFGKWNYTASNGEQVPKPKDYSDEISISPANPNFNTRKHSGEIVVSSMKKAKVHLIASSALSQQRPFYETGTTLLDHKNEGLYPLADKLDGVQPAIIGGEFVTFVIRARVFEYYDQYWMQASVDLKKIAERFLLSPTINGDLVTSAAVKLNKQTMDLLTELAELPETVALARDTLGLFRNKGRKLNKVLHEIRDELSGGRSLAQLGDRIASARLLYRYGILPLGYTLKDIKNVLKESFRRQYTKAYYRKDGSFPTDWEGWTFNGSATERTSVFLKRRLDPNSSIQQVQQVFGFNLPLTLWELTPWSLVVDWALKVGDYLTAINVYPSLQDAGTYSVKRSISGTYVQDADSSKTVSVSIDFYERVVINYQDHLVLQSDLVLNNARKMDALAFSWQVIRNGIKKLKS